VQFFIRVRGKELVRDKRKKERGREKFMIAIFKRVIVKENNITK
jgi:hypothetical protein